MKPDPSYEEMVSDKGASVDEGYEAWARAKIERALEQSRDRAKMIPAEQLWRDLGLES